MAAAKETVKINNKIPVKSAFLHQTLTWPGTAMASEKSITSAKFKNIQMFWCPHGLEIHLSNKKNEPEICIVPHANVANAILVSADTE